MLQSVRYSLVFMMGMALGTLYFMGLWHTLKRLPEARSAIRCLFGSFLVRMTAAMAGFGLALYGGWDQLVVALCGFIAAREILVRHLGRKIPSP